MDQPYLDTVIYDNFCEMIKGRFESCPDRDAIRYMSGNDTVNITYREMTEQIAAVYGFFRSKNMKNRHIAILSENRYEYIIIYLAAVLDNVIIPLDRELDSETVGKCLEKFDADMLFCTDRTAEKAAGFSGDTINIDRDFGVILNEKLPIEEFFLSAQHTDKDRFAVLASTSGTDGDMKGVMLSQYNVIVNVRGTLENNVLKDPTIAFLPMNHTYGFNPCMLATLYNGTTLCLCLSVKHLLRDLKAFDPYFFGAVPMVIEGMYDGIQREIKKRGKEKTVARLIKLSRFFLKFRIDLRHIFFGSFINRRLRLVVNGGAALRAELVEKFGDIGITILNGYGLTECAPTIAVSRVCNNVAGSAGTIMKHIDVRIAEDGEILVKGPNVMLGYYKNEEATKAAFRDGYFATGDTGYTDRKVIYVTGRKKNLIILGNGKNVPPEMIEDRLGSIPCVKECLVVPKKAAGRNTILCAKIVLRENCDSSSLREDIAAVNSGLPEYMRIDDFEIMESEFEKNSSRKIKRNLYV